jgi:hypothetical protein
MPTERTPQKLASKNKLEAASARKTRAKLVAETAASGKICPDGSMGSAKTAEEGSQIHPEPAPLEVVEATQRSRLKLRQKQQEKRHPITYYLTVTGARITQASRKAKAW